MQPNDVTSHLRPGERLLWQGAPDASVTFAPQDLFLIPFSLLWCGFAIFWESTVYSDDGAPFFFKLFGVPFVLIGIYMVAGRFFFKRRLKRRTVYALTNQRALIVVNGTTVSDSPVKDQRVTIKKARNGAHASVVIGTTATGSAMYSNTGMDALMRNRAPEAFGLYDVADPAPMLLALDQART